MQKLFIIFIVAILSSPISSCKRIDDEDVDNGFEAIGEILGLDLTLCACCGGYLVKIDGIEQTYNVSAFPANNDLDIDNAVFPLAVNLDWTENVSQTCTNIISIEAIEME